MLTPDNYDAYKGRQRQQDDARKQFLTVAKLEGDNSSPLSDAQLSDHVAELTGSKPAPEDMVKANRELFREVIDNARVDNLRDRAPVTLAMLSDPKDTLLSRDHYDFLASIEQVVGNLVRPSRTIQGGAGKEGGGWSSPSIPDVGNETVTDYRKVNSRLPASPDASPEQEGGSAERTGASRPNSTLPASAPMATRPADATAVPPENPGVNPNDAPVGDASQTVPAATPAETEAGSGIAAPAMPENQGVGTASALGGVPPQTAPDAVPSVAKQEQVAATPATQGNSSTNTAGALEGATSQTAPSTGSSAAVPEGGSAIGGAEGFGWDDGISPDSYMPFRSRDLPMPLGPTFEKPEIKLPEDAPSKRAAIAEAIAGLGKNPGYEVVAAFRDLISRQSDIPQDIALDVLSGVANGSLTQEQALEKLNHTPSPERERIVDEVANAAMLTEEQAKVLEERLKHQPYIPVEQALEAFQSVRSLQYTPQFAKYLLTATTDEELANITEAIIHAKEKSPDEIKALRKRIYEMNAIDPLLADKVLADRLGDKVDEKTARRILARIGTADHIVESAKGLIGSAWESVGNWGELIGRAVQKGESDTRRSLVNEIISLKGKSQEDFGIAHDHIVNLAADNWSDQNLLLTGLEMMRDGEDPEKVLDYISPSRIGSNMIKLGQQRQKDAKDKFGALEGREHILGRGIGEAVGPVGVGLVLNVGIPGMGVIYPAGNSGAKAYNEAIDAKASEKNAMKAAGETTFVNLLAGLPLGAVMKLPGLNKLAGSSVDRYFLQPGVDILAQVGAQAGTNAAAKWSYDKNRDYLKDTSVAAATSVLLSGLKIGGGAAFGRVRAGINAYRVRNAISEAQEAIRRDGVLKDFEGLLEKNVPIVVKNRQAIYDLVQQKVEKTAHENLYFRVEDLESSLTKAGVDPKAFVESLGGVTLGDFQKAAKTGGYVRLSLATFAAYVMGTKASKALREVATFRPGMTSPAMAEEFLKNLPTGKSSGTVTAPSDGKPAPTDASPKDKAGQP